MKRFRFIPEGGNAIGTVYIPNILHFDSSLKSLMELYKLFGISFIVIILNDYIPE